MGEVNTNTQKLRANRIDKNYAEIDRNSNYGVENAPTPHRTVDVKDGNGVPSKWKRDYRYSVEELPTAPEAYAYGRLRPWPKDNDVERRSCYKDEGVKPVYP